MEAAAIGAHGGRGGEGETKLKRAIGPRVLTVFVVGDILGAGIYALVGEVGAEVGGAIWTAFLAAFVMAVGVLLWALNRIAEGPPPDVEVERLQG